MNKVIFHFFLSLVLIFIEVNTCSAQGWPPPNPPDPIGNMHNGSSTDIKIYPSPFTTQLKIVFDTFEYRDVKLFIYDISGRCVLQKTINQPDNTIVTVELLSGVYFCKIYTPGKVINKLIVKPNRHYK
jgi:hypothetical protein